MTTTNPKFAGMQSESVQNDWKREAWRWGLGGVASLAIGSSTWFGLVLPMRDYQKTMMDSMVAVILRNVETQERNAVTLAGFLENQKQQTVIQSQNASALERLTRNQEETNRLQQQLLDATRRGAWLEKKSDTGT